MVLSKGVFQSQVEAVNLELSICTLSDRYQICLCLSWKLKRCSSFGCELFDRQSDPLIHLHTHPSQSAWHTIGGEWVKAEVWIVPDSWFYLCSLEKRFILGFWEVTFPPKLIHSRFPSLGWAQTNLQGLGNPELHRQALLSTSKVRVQEDYPHKVKLSVTPATHTAVPQRSSKCSHTCLPPRL